MVHVRVVKMPAVPSLQLLALLAIDPDLTVQAISSAFIEESSSSGAKEEDSPAPGSKSEKRRSVASILT